MHGREDFLGLLELGGLLAHVELRFEDTATFRRLRGPGWPRALSGRIFDLIAVDIDGVERLSSRKFGLGLRHRVDRLELHLRKA